MTKAVRCRDVGFDCEGVIRGETEEEVLAQAAAHAQSAHDVKEITPEIEELLADSGTDAESLGTVTSFASRVSSDVVVSQGERVRLVVDSAKFFFFDPSTGERIGYEPDAVVPRK